jgi:hypothetical protein
VEPPAKSLLLEWVCFVGFAPCGGGGWMGIHSVLSVCFSVREDL